MPDGESRNIKPDLNLRLQINLYVKRFLENGGEKSVIGSLLSANAAIKGESGTTITR